MFAYLLSLYVCTGTSFLNMGPGCGWQPAPAPYAEPFYNRHDCGEVGKSILRKGSDKSIRMYKCVLVPSHA